MSEYYHVPVLVEELIKAISLKEDEVIVDCTLGGGGHTQKILESMGKTGRVIGLDRDAEAVTACQKRFAEYIEAGRLKVIRSRFSRLKDILENEGEAGRVSLILADLGVSSAQLSEDKRGFSFDRDGPLDMRMDQDTPLSAAQLIQTASEEELEGIFREFGEEPKARRLAQSIAEVRSERRFISTKQFADFIGAKLHYLHKSRKHPATRIFQAIRIAINEELEELKGLLRDSFDVLKPGGKLAIITFHSLEDRMVKRKFREWAGKNAETEITRHLPIAENQKGIKADGKIKAKLIAPFPIKPSEEEVTRNPRARSAKMRIVEKI